MPTLVYSGECPYCRTIAAAISAADVSGRIRTLPIEDGLGREMVEDHHGEYVHAPHLFTEEKVYFGIAPVARGLAEEVPKAYLPTGR